MARTGNKPVKAYSDFLHEVSTGGTLLSSTDIPIQSGKQTQFPSVPYKANIYSQFIDTENIRIPVELKDDAVNRDLCQGDTDTRALVDSVNKAHEKVQKCIHEYIKIKQTIKTLEKYRVDLEEKTSALVTAMQFAESLTGHATNVEAIRTSVQEVHVLLNDISANRMMILKKQEDEIKNLSDLISLLGNPPQSETIMYQCGYNL